MTMDGESQIIIHPRRQKHEQKLPATGLLLANPAEAAACIEGLRQNGGEERFLFNSGLAIAPQGEFFVAGPAIGAPMAALTLEKLIALGARRVILFGWCGAICPRLQVGDVVVPDAALSGEGTSRYYVAGEVPPPCGQLSGWLAGLLAGRGLEVSRGRIWSTDAIYREDRRMLAKLNTESKVDGIDMEFSALCAVAHFRKIAFGAVLVVSDELWGESWRPGFAKPRFKERKQRALDLVLDRLLRGGEW